MKIAMVNSGGHIDRSDIPYNMTTNNTGKMSIVFSK